MIQKMLFSEMVEAAKPSRLVGQLLHLKRCFGSRAKIGIVTTPGNLDLCGTVSELVRKGHSLSGLEWMDTFLAAVPSISELHTNDFLVVPSRYSDSGPPCPWDIAKRDQENARSRANKTREEYRQMTVGKSKEYCELEKSVQRLMREYGEVEFLAATVTGLDLKYRERSIDAYRQAADRINVARLNLVSFFLIAGSDDVKNE